VCAHYIQPARAENIVYTHPHYIDYDNIHTTYLYTNYPSNNLNLHHHSIVINQQSLFDLSEPGDAPPRSIIRSFCDKFHNFITVAVFGCCI
jgi:hypothetical protein